MMLSTYGLKLSELGKLSVREFSVLLNQSFNIANYRAGGKIELQTPEEKQKMLKAQALKLGFKEVKSSGAKS